MFKKIIFGSIFFLALQNNAQQSSASPYSAHGLGESKFRGTIENRSMGGINILHDSIHINIMNPATLQSIKLSTLTIGGTFTPEKIKINNTTEKAQRSTFDYIAMAFPAGKTVFGAGLYTNTQHGYKISEESNNTVNRYIGNGSTYRTYISTGYQLNNRLSLGAEFSYDFGKLEKENYSSSTDVINGTLHRQNMSISGTNFKIGAIFKTKLGKLDFLNSATLFMPMNLKVQYESSKGIYSTATGNELTPTDYKTSGNIKKRNPSNLTFSSGIGKERNWYVGIESSFFSKGDLDLNLNDQADFNNATQIKIGGYFIPKYNAFEGYFNKITYRAGLRYENTGLVYKGNQVKDQAATLGLGLPIGGSLSNINLGFEYGKKGIFKTDFVQENYMNFSVGISFNDRWFIKRKYD